MKKRLNPPTYKAEQNRPKPSCFGLFTRKKLAVAIAAQLMVCSSALAGPTGGVVTGGEGVIEQAGTETTITQGTDRLSIDWDSFNIGSDERVQFIQPSQSSVALNRIVGNGGSQILGQIDANGHVILVNPNGIFFGRNSSVNVGGLIASGLQINPDDFINGNLVFEGLEGTSGAVINTGLLNASLGGNVTLLGKEVDNCGLIMASMGRVNLVAGEQVVLTFDTQGLLGVQVDEAVLQDELIGEGNEAVKNSGEIKAESGQILLSASKARNVFSLAVNHGKGGVAKSVVYHEDGTFTLGAGSNVINTGTLDASGINRAGDVVVLGENIVNAGAILANVESGVAGNIELHSSITTELAQNSTIQADAQYSGQGGDVKLQGINIGLFDDASVTATGVNGGGQILIGGDREGLNPQVKNSDFVYVGENTNVTVDAVQSGDGGKLIVFAEDTARIYGHLSAKGGELKGDGGFVETSGKKGFVLLQTPSISSANGSGGHWLIDPYDITVKNDFEADSLSSGAPKIYESSTSDTKLSKDSIVDALESDIDVTIITGDGGDEAGNITIEEPIELSSSATFGSTLSLIAHNNIVIEQSITAGDKSANRSLTINLTANGIPDPENPDADVGVFIRDGVEIDTNGGDFNITQAYDVDFSNASIDLTSANYSGALLDDLFPGRTDSADGLAPSGSLAINALNDVTLGSITTKGRDVDADTYKINVVAGGNITLAQGLTYDNNPTEDFERFGAINNNSFSTLSLTAGDSIIFEGDVERAFADDVRREHQDRLNIRLQANTNANAIDSGLGSIVFGTSPGDPGDLNIVTAGGDITIINAVNVDWSGDVLDVSSAFGPGSISVTTLGDVETGTIKTNFDAVGAGVTGAQELRVMDVSLLAGGSLTLNSDITTDSGNITLAGSAIALGNANLDSSRDGGGFEGSQGNITITTSSDIQLNDVDALGDFSLLAGDPANDSFNVTQDDGGSLSVLGASVFDVGEGNLTLEADVVLQGGIEIVSAGDADFLVTSPAGTDDPTFDINLVGVDVTGDFNIRVNSNGDIVGTGPLLVGGAASFYAGDNDITLDHTANDFIGPVFINPSDAGTLHSDDVVINDINDLILGAVADDPADPNPTFRVNDSLSVSAGGDISQISLLEVGEVVFTAEASASITLTQENLIDDLTIVGGPSASIRNAQNLRLLGDSTLDTLSLDVSGDLTQDSRLIVDALRLNVSGTTTLTNTQNAIDSLATMDGGRMAGGTIDSRSDLELGSLSLEADFNIDLNEDAALSFANNAVLSGSDSRLSIDANNQALVLDSGDPVNAFNLTFADGLDLRVDDVSSLVLNAVLSQNDADSEFEVIGNSNANTFTIGDQASHDLTRAVLDGSGGSDIFNGPSQATAWVFSDDATNPVVNVGSGNDFEFTSFAVINSGVGADTFEIDDDINILINSGSGIDTFTLGDDFNNVSIDGGADADILQTTVGDNDWSLASGAVINGGDDLNFVGVEELRGGGTSNSLTGEDFTSVWGIGAGAVSGNDGTLSYNDGTDKIISFSGFSDFIGGEEADTFNINTAGVTANINGDDGADVLNAFAGVAREWGVDGSAGTLKNTPEDGGLITFNDVEVLNGSDGDVDAVVFDSASPSVNITINAGNAAGIIDVISYADVDQDTIATVGLGVGGLNDFEAVTGNGGNLILQSSTTEDSTWFIGDNENTGSVVVGTNTTNFSNFAHLLGGSGADAFTFEADVTGSVNSGAGADTFNINNSITATINAGAGVDTFNILALGITADIIGGDDADILNSFAGDSRTWTINGSAGTFHNDGDPVLDVITFDAIETLNGSAADVDTVLFSAISDDVSVVINAGDAASVTDVISYEGVDSDTEATVGLGVGGLNGFETVVGNGGNLVLQGSSTADATWFVGDNENTGSVVVGTNTTNFRRFAHLLGGSGADTFTFDANVTGSVNSGGGTDTFNMKTSIDAPINAGSGADTFNILALGITASINGGDDADILNSFAGDSRTWTIDGSTGTFLNDNDIGGELITFDAIETLNGSAADVDTVLFSAISDDVSVIINARDAVDVTDVISYEGVDSDTEATVGLGVGGLNGFESVVGNGGNLVLQGSSTADATWFVGGNENTGSVVVGTNTTNFSNFAHLLGGSGADTFTFDANVTGSVNSGGGPDTFNINTSIDAPINAGSGADTFNILALGIDANIIGGNDADILNTFAGDSRTWAVSGSGGTFLNDNDIGDEVITFDAIETLNGSAADVDTVLFSTISDSVSMTINARDADGVVDIISYAGVSQNTVANINLGVGGLNGFEEVKGNNANLVLLGGVTAAPADTTFWVVDAPNAGTVTLDGKVTQFSDFAHLLGGSGKDAFTLEADVIPSDGVGSIGGGAGDNTFNINTTMTALISGGTGADIFNIGASNITATVDGAGSGDADVINAFVGVNREWDIGASNITLNNVGEAAHITITNVDTLNGSDGDVDTVFLNTVVSSVDVNVNAGDAAAVTDVISYAKIPTATVTNVGLSVNGLNGFEQITGNNGNLVLEGGVTAVEADSTLWEITSQNAGSVDEDGNITLFTGFSQVLGGSGRDTFTLAADLVSNAGVTAASINGGAGGDTFNINSAVTVLLNGNANNDTFNIAAGTNTVNGGIGNDVFNITAATSGALNGEGGNDTFNLAIGGTVNKLNVNGQSGNDTFNILAASVNALIDGGSDGANADTLVAADLANNWFITDSLSLLTTAATTDITAVTATTAGVVFSELESLTGANAAVDHFTFIDDISVLNIAAGNGDAIDVIDYSRLVNRKDITIGSDALVGFEQVVGNNGQLSVTGDNTAVWTVTGANEGAVLVDDQRTIFAGFTHLQGGEGSDDFTLTTPTSAVTSIDGGDGIGENTVTFLNAVNGDRTVALSAAETLSTGVQLNINNINALAASDVFANTLVSGTDNVWTVTAENEGSVTHGSASTGFIGFNHLSGGTGSDSFTFTENGALVVNSAVASAGAVDGGLDINNSLTAYAERAVNDWVVTDITGGTGAGSVTSAHGDHAISFAGIQVLNGGDGSDTLNAPNTENVWDLDQDFSGDLNSLDFTNIKTLIGGSNTDTFNVTAGSQQGLVVGGGNEDILNLANYGERVDVTVNASVLNPATSAAGFLVQGVENVIGDATGSGRLFAQADSDNIWNFEDGRSGTVGVTGTELTFSNMDSFVGGDLSDNFILTGTGYTGSIVGGLGANTITMLNGDNSWTITGTGQGVLSNEGGSNSGSFSDMLSLVGGTGVDIFDFGGVTTASFLSVDGNAGTDDRLIGFNAGNTWTVLAANQGELQSAASDLPDLNFINVEHLQGNTANDAFILTALVSSIVGGGGVNTLDATGVSGGLQVGLTLNAGAILNTERLSAISVDGTNEINELVSTEDSTWSISATNAGSVLQTSGGDAPFDTTFDGFNVLTGTQNNTFNLGENGQLLIAGNTSGRVNGGAGFVNVLQAADQQNTWLINGTNSGTVSTLATAGIPLEFNNVDTLLGGNNSDTFSFVGVDLVTETVSTITGGDGVDTLNAKDQNNTWTLDENLGGRIDSVLEAGDSVTSIAFSGIEALNGGALADTFIVVGNEAVLAEDVNVGAMDGGAGANTLDLSGYGKATNVTVGLATERTGLLVNNVQTLIGSDSVGNAPVANALFVETATDNTWLVEAEQSGSVTLNSIDAEALDAAYTIDFSHFENVSGGSHADDFTLSGRGHTGTIDGGLGDNSIAIAANNTEANNWLLSGVGAGVLNRLTPGDASTGLEFNGIQTLVGGENADLFDFSQTVEATFVLLDGGGSGLDKIIGMNANTNWSITDVNGGFFNADGGIASFANVEFLTGGEQGDNFNLVSSEAISDVYVAGVIDGGDPVKSSDPEAVGDVIFFGSYTGSRLVYESSGTDVGDGTINIFNLEGVSDAVGAIGGPGDNVWEITGPNTARLNFGTVYNNLATIEGGASDDLFIFTNANASTGEILGGEGTNTIQIDFDTQAHDWTITGEYTGSLTNLASTEDATHTTFFENIQNLIGSAATDTFLFADAGSMNTIDGRAGDDRMDFVSHTSFADGVGHRITVTDNFTVVDNGLEFDRRSTITRTHNAVTTSVLEHFNGIENIVMGATDDHFILTGNAGGLVNIDAGLGADHFNSSLWVNDTAIALSTQIDSVASIGDAAQVDSGKVFNLFGFEAFSANHDQNNTFQGLLNAESSWLLTQDFIGTLSFESPDTDLDMGMDVDLSSTGETVFNGFQNLIGGDSGNHFDLAGFEVHDVQGGQGLDVLVGGSALGSQYTWRVSALNEGSMTTNQGIDSYNIHFSGIDQLLGGVGADSFIINDASYFTGLVDGGAVNALSGAVDQLTLNRSGDQSTYLWSLNGNTALAAGTVSSIDTLSGSALDAQLTFANIERLHGSAGDWLQGANQNNTWDFTGVGSGTVTGDIDAVTANIRFNDFSRFVGGTGVDVFNVNRMESMRAVEGYIDGGLSGGDVLNITDTGSGFGIALSERLAANQPANGAIDLTVWGIETINSTGLNTLYGASQTGVDYSWLIDGQYQGRVSSVVADVTSTVQFNNISKIYAGTSNDTFQTAVSEHMDYIHGGDGEGRDLIDYSQVTQNQVVVVNSDDGGLGVAGLEGFIGNNDGSAGAQYQSILKVLDGPTVNGADPDQNDWVLTGLNDGTFIQNDGQEISFENFNHLHGGRGQDTFTIKEGGRITGVLLGGVSTATDTGSDSVIVETTGSTQLAILLEQDALNLASGVGLGVAGYTQVANVSEIKGAAVQTTLLGAEANNEWVFTGADAGSVSFEEGAFTRSITFSSVSNIQGNSQEDVFRFDGTDNLSGWLSGGDGADTAYFNYGRDTATIVAISSDPLLSTLDDALNIRGDIEQLTSNAGEQSVNQTRLIGRSGVNTWLIEQTNGGVLTNGTDAAITFEGFDTIIGNEQNDTFTVDAYGRLSGFVDGGEGLNRVNADSAIGNLRVAVGLNPSADLQLSNIQNVSALNGANNILLGANTDNDWLVSQVNEGSLNKTLKFKGFSRLVGGVFQDVFTLGAEGELSGYIDGGANIELFVDRVDYSQVNRGVDVHLANTVSDINVNDPGSALVNIERVQGNNTGASGLGTVHNSSLTAADTVNIWSISDFDAEQTLANGVNDGQVLGDSRTVSFVDFNILNGGSDSDTFTQLDGVITGIVSGAGGNDTFHITNVQNSGALYQGNDGDDVFNYTLSPTTGNVSVAVDGGTGVDRIFVTGQSDGFGARYYAIEPNNLEDASGISASLIYDDFDPSRLGVTQTVGYSNVEAVHQQALLQELVVESSTSGIPNNIVMGAGYFSANNHTSVFYDDNTSNFTLIAGKLDKVNLSGAIQVSNTLSLFNGVVSVAPDTVISTVNLVLDGVELERGPQDANVNLNILVSSLSVANISDELSVVQGALLPNLMLQTMTNITGDISVTVEQGGVQQAGLGDFEVLGSFTAKASNGSVALTNTDNAFTGVVSLKAENGDVSFSNSGAIQFGTIDTNNLNVIAAGDVTANGIVSAKGITRISTTGKLSLLNINNALNQLYIEKAQSVAVSSLGSNELSLHQIQSDGSLLVQANTLNVNGLITSRTDVSLQAVDQLNVFAPIQAQGSIELGVSSGAYLQQSDVESLGGDIALAVNGDVIMQNNSALLAVTGSVLIGGVTGGPLEGGRPASGVVELARVRASTDTGSVTIVTAESVVDANDVGAVPTLNVTAKDLIVNARKGVGVGDALETQLQTVDIVSTGLNSSEQITNIEIDNTGLLEVKRLWTNYGDIDLTNDKDVTVSSGSINTFYDGQPLLATINTVVDFTVGQGEPRSSAQVLPVNDESTAQLTINVEDGDLRMQSPFDKNNPSIAAFSVELNIGGDIGGTDDANLVLYVSEDFDLTAENQWRPFLWGFDLLPQGLIVQNVTPVPTINAGDQLVTLESLEDVDPAVFTLVKNYYYSELSILLPEDQRYDGDEEEYEDE